MIDALAEHPYAALAFAFLSVTLAVTVLPGGLRRLWLVARAQRWHSLTRR